MPRHATPRHATPQLPIVSALAAPPDRQRTCAVRSARSSSTDHGPAPLCSISTGQPTAAARLSARPPAKRWCQGRHRNRLIVQLSSGDAPSRSRPSPRARRPRAARLQHRTAAICPLRLRLRSRAVNLSTAAQNPGGPLRATGHGSGPADGQWDTWESRVSCIGDLA